MSAHDPVRYSEHDFDEDLTCQRCGKTREEIVAEHSGHGPCLVYPKKRNIKRLLVLLVIMLPMFALAANMFVLPFTGPITSERTGLVMIAGMGMILLYKFMFPIVLKVLERFK